MVWSLICAVVGAVGWFTYMELVKKGILRYNRYDRRVQGTLKVGHQAPDVTLTMYDGSDVRLSTLWKAKPVVLIFGSCT